MKQLFYVTVILFLAACESGGSDDYKRPAGGSPDEIVVVVDSAVWAGSVGIELRKILQAPMQGMPQDEPLFEVYQVNPLKLNSVLKSAYNMIFITTLDRRTSQSKEMRKMFTDESLKKIQSDTSFFQVVENDKFAKNQKTLFLFGNNASELSAHIAQSRAEILHLFETRARDLTKARIFRQREKALEDAIKKNHGYSFQIPYGWDLSKDLPDFVWVRELDLDKEKNIFIYQQPYRGPQDFNDIDGLRDRISQLHLRDSQRPDLYIKRQEIIPVVTKQVNFNGKFAIEARGLWAVSDMTAGGPFLSYVLVDEENAMLYYIEGYVYHAGGKKKRLMREMDAILSTFTIPSETTK